jgi:hypothetical protein
MSIAPQSKYWSVEEVLGFVDRTTSHGVPVRVALRRAERRYGVSRGLIKAFMRGAK